jgi:hypothetical protein
MPYKLDFTGVRADQLLRAVPLQQPSGAAINAMP